MAGPPVFAIAPDDLTAGDVLALLTHHLAEMHACSPACKVHAMPAERLRSPDVTFFAARVAGELAAVGALRDLGNGTGEVKSMRAAEAWRGRGAGRAILRHLLAEARARGYREVGLETGQHPVFGAAHGLYEQHGFRRTDRFADYLSDDFTQCMVLPLG